MKTYIDAHQFETILQTLEIAYEAQSGFVKCKGAKGRQVYIARTKRVGRVDISGFEMPEGTAGVENLGEASFGAVKQQLVFTDRTEAEILETFTSVLEHMMTLPAVETVAKVRKAGTKVDAVGWSTSVTDSAKARLEAIRNRSLLMQKGVATAEEVVTAE